MSHDVSAVFVAAARECLDEGLHKIEHCLAQLDDEAVWWRPAPELNSIANLMLHLSGNLRQWIVSGVGGAPDVRDRPLEFADRSSRPKAELLQLLRGAVRDADDVLSRLTAQRLVQARRIQGFDSNMLAAVFSSVAHFRGHTQEIIHITRARLGDGYRFDFVPQGLEQTSAGGGGGGGK
jgi:hypothetical protein